MAEAEGRCLKAEASSFGYFLVPITHALEKNSLAEQNVNFSIYPNPLSSYIAVAGNAAGAYICKVTSEYSRFVSKVWIE